jgi:hypothetical protein
MYPANEVETIALYRAMEDRLEWRIVHLQSAFPDAIIEDREGRRLRAEFEFVASNFREHGHDPAGCDLIICWRNDWPDAPLPVFALAEVMFEKELRHERRRWQRREGALRRKLMETEWENADLRKGLAMWERVVRFQKELLAQRAATFSLAGVGEFYTDSPRTAERITRFFWEILRFPEVQAVLDRIEVEAHLDALGKL